MANYYASSRTNYFKVRDELEFENWLGTTNMEILHTEVDAHGNCLTALVPTAPDGEGWSLTIWEDDEGYQYEEERDLVQELAKHLEPGWVAIFMEAGAEKLRYVSGFAIAVNSDGNVLQLSLNDIYKQAEGMGEHITPAEY